MIIKIERKAGDEMETRGDRRGGGKEREKRKKTMARPKKRGKKKKTRNSLSKFSAADPIGSGCGGRSGSA